MKKRDGGQIGPVLKMKTKQSDVEIIFASGEVCAKKWGTFCKIIKTFY
jgi:hypothetical protein